MSITHKIIDYLRLHPEGVDDDELVRALSMKQRQQANSRCRALEKEKIVVRKNIRGKIHNFLTGVPLPISDAVVTDVVRPWFWEGNVQEQVANYLIVIASSSCLGRNV